MATVFRRKGQANWYYKFKNEHGQWVQRVGVTAKDVTQRLAAADEARAAQIAAGLIDPKAEVEIPA